MNALWASRLLKLPNKLFLELETHIESFEDLNSLICTSLFFHTLFQTRLYSRAIAADPAVLDDIMDEVLGNYFIDSLRLLFDHGLSVNLTTGIHQLDSILHYRCRRFDQERAARLARLLIEHGADIEAHDNDSATVLHIAARNSNFSLASLPFDHGAKVNAKTTDGITPLHFVCSADRLQDHAAMINLFLTHGADVDARDILGNTPLLVARERNYRVVLPALLAHGAEVAAHTHAKSPLHMAALLLDARDHALAKALIERGASINATSNGGRTPLHYACDFHHKKGLFMLRSRMMQISVCCTAQIGRG